MYCQHETLYFHFASILLQTGSGKTYTMGTGFDMALDADEVGVIPRAVNQIFIGIEERRREAIERNEPPPQYELTAQFLEVHMYMYSNMLSHGSYVIVSVVVSTGGGYILVSPFYIKSRLYTKQTGY